MADPATALTSVSLQKLADLLGGRVPDADVEITGVATIEAAGPNDLTFLANDRYVQALQSSKAGAVLVAEGYDGEAPMPMLRHEHPRLAFGRAVSMFHPPRPRRTGIHATAVIPESCRIGEDVFIGPYVVLGENVSVGDGSTLHAHCVAYDDVVIGHECVIHSHACLREGVRLGDRVVLQNGAMIGPDGFGFEPSEDGSLEPILQVGGVRLEDDVEVQANTCVDRAALGETVIGQGTKIDNLAQIGHGVQVGRHTIICGQVGLGGSTQIGNHVMLGGQAGFGGHTRVGDFALVGAQSGVVQDLEGGKEYVGTPAVDKNEGLRSLVYLPRLHTMARAIRKLERQVERLSQSAEEA